MTLNHCWFPSLLDSPTNISSKGLYNVLLTLDGLAQAQHIGTMLQSHLFGIEMKALVLWWGESGEVKRRVTRQELLM